MILITGVSGFIGKHLLNALIENYGSDQIVALTSRPITECAFLLHNNYCFDKGYFINSGYESIKTVIHAGAFIPKRSNEANNWNECNSNISNSAILLNCDFPNLEKVIFLSTVDVYGEEKIISESSPIDPFSLYGNSKFYCEKMITAWANKENKIHQILRIGHVYGPGEEAYQKIIPITIQKLLKKDHLQIWGTGEEARSFIYIKDVVQAILQSIKLEIFIGPVNIVSSQQISIKDLVNKLITISGQESKIEYIQSNAVSRNLIFDNTKMKKYLLNKEIGFDEGVFLEWNYMRQKTDEHIF